MHYLYFLFLFLGLWSCSGKQHTSDQQPTKDAGYYRVMHVHDSIMPLTGDLFKLRKKLSFFESNADTIMRSDIFRIKKMLEDADEAMMSWMRTFNEPNSSIPENQRNSYYVQELENISAVGSQMYAAIDSAQILIQRLENETQP